MRSPESSVVGDVMPLSCDIASKVLIVSMQGRLFAFAIFCKTLTASASLPLDKRY